MCCFVAQLFYHPRRCLVGTSLFLSCTNITISDASRSIHLFPFFFFFPPPAPPLCPCPPVAFPSLFAASGTGVLVPVPCSAADTSIIGSAIRVISTHPTSHNLSKTQTYHHRHRATQPCPYSIVPRLQSIARPPAPSASDTSDILHLADQRS